jgi:hypothetical protein
MGDLDSDGMDAFHNIEGHYAQFSQAGSMEESSLNQLRDHIKKVMIPLLIKSFQLKLELSQAISLPSRLQPLKQKQSTEEIVGLLRQLDKDLQVLLLWCQSCRNQIQKAIVLPEEETKTVLTPSSASVSNPAVSKSFSDAVSAQSSHFKNVSSKELPKEENLSEDKSSKKKKRWFKIF